MTPFEEALYFPGKGASFVSISNNGIPFKVIKGDRFFRRQIMISANYGYGTLRKGGYRLNLRIALPQNARHDRIKGAVLQIPH